MRRDKDFLSSVREGAVLMVMSLLISSASCAKDNVIMRGALVIEPCMIAAGDENIQLDFESITDRYLYINKRTSGQLFKVYLTDCDPALAGTVSITFNGLENTNLPGLLAIDGSSQASGIAIGIETPEGKPLPINEQGGKRGLFIGKNRIPLKAYIQVEPQALIEKKIRYGHFMAVATFLLAYE